MDKMQLAMLSCCRPSGIERGGDTPHNVDDRSDTKGILYVAQSTEVITIDVLCNERPAPAQFDEVMYKKYIGMVQPSEQFALVL
jgi:hypothetical protein